MGQRHDMRQSRFHSVLWDHPDRAVLAQLSPPHAAQLADAHEGQGQQLQPQAGDRLLIAVDRREQRTGLAWRDTGHRLFHLARLQHPHQAAGTVALDVAHILRVIEHRRDAPGHPMRRFNAAALLHGLHHLNELRARDLVDRERTNRGVREALQRPGNLPLVLAVGQGRQFDLQPLLRDRLERRCDLRGGRGSRCVGRRALGLRMRSAGLRQRHGRVAAIGPRALFAGLRIVGAPALQPGGRHKEVQAAAVGEFVGPLLRLGCLDSLHGETHGIALLDAMDDTTIGGWLAWYRPGCNGTIMDAPPNEKAPPQRLRGALRDHFGSILAERGSVWLTFHAVPCRRNFSCFSISWGFPLFHVVAQV
ncbi:protein of unknown function [Thiomonas sp. Sup16B3]|nr:protein of unknown function [Thiomonas sp. Sup16B3]